MAADTIDDLYELSPMQRGMLFHTLYTPHSGVYIEQALYSLQGQLNPALLQRAWQSILTRHPMLRTAFVWEGLDEPLQVVQHEVPLPWQELDWRGLSSTALRDRLEERLACDRMQGFDMARVPLLRITLLRVSPQTYYFLLTYHHLLLDGWSLATILQEVLTIYEGSLRGDEPVLEVRRPYHDYIAWLRQQNLAEAEAFWRRYLQDFTTPTPLMIDKQIDVATDEAEAAPGMYLDDEHEIANVVEETRQPQRLQLSGGRSVALQGFTLSRDQTAALRRFAREHQVTVNTLVQGAWAMLLSRYSGETDIVFGATVAGRPTTLAGADKMIGLFINTLPVRVRVPEDVSLIPWLLELQQQQAEVRQYDYSPLVQIQGWSEAPRERPLFESLVVFENYPLHAQELEEAPHTLDVSALQTLEQTNYPLVLIVGPWTRLEVQLGYEIAHFAPRAIARMLGHLRMLLEAFQAAPKQRLAEYSLLTERERQQLLVTWNQTQAEYPVCTAWHALFQEQVSRTPTAPALVYRSQTLTYAELELRANQVAWYLRRAGVGPEVRVALCMERSPALLIGLLGILKAGGAYLPCDPAYPVERLAFMLADARVPLLLTQETFRVLFADSTARIICLDTEQEAIGQEMPMLPAVPILPDNAAYVIYTSGSTGTPKGVIGTHRALLNHSAACISTFALQASDRVLQFAALSFDVLLEECLPSWAAGAAVVLWPEALPPAPADFTRFVQDEQLSVLNLPSSYWHEWVSELARTRTSPPETLRALIVGSERVLPAQVLAWYALSDREIALYNAYGLTETTVTALLYCLPPAAPELFSRTQTIPVGQPINNVQAYVLDARMQPAPMGLAGVLYIGGLALTRGYLLRPDLTAERFIPHPFSPQPGERLYHTGDQARILSNGAIEILGRLDAQVKIRGFRIEPGEVESRLSQYPGVQECVISVREDAPGDIRLVAYIVTRERDPGLIAKLQAYAGETLPSYMAPSAFVLLDTLPRTVTGKINVRQLPPPDQGPRSAQDAYSAPRTQVEEILAGIWAAVLHLESIGRDDHFFRLGGHSLQATQIVARLREILQIDLPVRAIYDAPTIAALAKRIEDMRKQGLHSTLPPLQPMERPDPLPLSFAQERLWFLDQLQPESPFYNMPMALSLKGPLESSALERALNALVARHEPLRTTIVTLANQPAQQIAPQLHLPLAVIELAQREPISRQELEARVRYAMLREARQPFELERGPLMRATLLRLGQDEHVLLLTLHHIIADGWSIEILLQELSVLYAGESHDQPAQLPELPVQYADFALWQRAWLQGPPLEQQLAYWKQHLAGAPAILALPTDYPRPAVQTFDGAIAPFLFPPALSQRLQTLSREEGATLFMVLLAALQTLFARYTNQYDIVIGTPTAGRIQRETEGLVGLFLNTLPLRTTFSGESTFRELLAQVREIALDAYMHQDVPFEKLVEALQPERNQSHSPLFQVLFVFQNTPDKPLQWPGLHTEILGIGSRTAKFDLSIEMQELSTGIRGFVEYNTDLFEEATIKRMITHLRTLLEGAVVNPDLWVADLPLLTKAERSQTLVEWNATRTEYPRGLCLHEPIEEQAEQAPDAIAVTFQDEQITYRTLNSRANQLAHRLRGIQVAAEHPVGVCMERSIEMVIALLAILKAGGAYVPLDPDYPEERLVFQVEDARIAALLTQQRFLTRFSQQGVPVLCFDLESDRALIAQESRDNPSRVSRPDNIAYIIYTSGSTGKPKGVMVPHQGIVNRLQWMQQTHQIGEADRVMQKTPFSFDVSVWEFFWPLSVGARLVIAEPEGHKDSSYLLHLIAEQQMTIVHFVPSMLQVFLDEPHMEACASLRKVICSGEALPFELQQRFFSRLDAELHNLYGPTEASVDVTFWACEREQTRQIVPIGRPIANTRIYLLDQHLEPVPPGVPGELYIGGIGLARGYARRPDLSAERFIPDPFSPVPGARLYRTGDLARYIGGEYRRFEGAIEFLGRIDHQVKIRGFRVEPGEIESVLLQYPAIQECVVLAREDTPGQQSLAAYVVGSRQRSGDAALLDFLRTRLPAYMLPSAFVWLEELPLTPNGKLDRRALPRPEQGQAAEANDDATRTPIEDLLATIWMAVLQRERVGIHENFFELGGHSLLATRIISRIRETFHINIPLRLLFEAPTIAELASRIEAIHVEESGDSEDVPALLPQQRPAHLPLSFAQERIWFLGQLEPEKPSYNIPFALMLRGELRVELLESCLNQLLQRHEVLRTSFSLTEGIPQQVILAELTLRIPVRTLEGAEDAQRALTQRLALEEALTSFDLALPPLLRAALLKLSEREHVLLLTLHHSIFDAWSIGILVNEWSALYTAAIAGEEARLPELLLQYADYALWQRAWLQGSTLERQLAYWRTTLQGAPEVLDLPLDHPRPAVQAPDGAVYRLTLPSAFTRQLHVLSQQEGVTLFMTLLAAFQTLLLRYTGEEDLVIGTPVAGRTQHETEALVGCFVNTLPLRTSLAGDPTFCELLTRVRDGSLEAFWHQEVPFERIVDAIQPERSLGHHPLFQVMFALQNIPVGDLSLPGLDVESLVINNPTTKFDITFTFLEGVDGLDGFLEYNLHLFERATIERLATHFIRLLEGIVQAPDRRLSVYPLLSEAETQALLTNAVGPIGQESPQNSLQQLLEVQAARTPGAVAVIAGERQLTYAELDRRANQIAHVLRAQGVRPETRVGLYMERSLDLLPALLGILKAGGAYVPLDPTIPAARLAFVLEDARIAHLLTLEHLRALLPAQSLTVLCLDDAQLAWDSAPVEALSDETLPEHLAYIIYTSGSTGQPKGVLISQRGLVNYLTWAARTYLGSEGGAVPLHSSMSFDLAVTSLFAPLLVGVPIVLLPEQVGVEALGEALREGDWGLVKVTPAHLRALGQALTEDLELGTIQTLVVGGEALLGEQLTMWQAAFPGLRLVNEYGPTETVVGCCIYEVTLDEPLHGAVPIGRPIANTWLYILDRYGRLVPPGGIGELFIGGAGVARGYQGRADLTAERFVPDAFSGRAGARLYRTGDLVRALPDGNLLYLGRNDQQVKLYGFRIEPGEIEAWLLRHPTVQEVSVLLREASPGAQMLVAYIVPTPGEQLAPEELRSYLRQALPDYMVPAAFVALEALPLTANGKVDRQALPSPDSARQRAYESPITEVEETLAAIWAEVLNVERVGRHDTFFELGGQSLLATRVISHVQRRLGVEMPLRTLFESPTVAGFAAAIIQKTLAETEDEMLLQLIEELDELPAE